MLARMKGRNLLWSGLGIVLAMLLAWGGTPASPAASEPDLATAPELVIPVVNSHTKIHIGGSFTCETRRNCFDPDGQSIIEFRAVVRLLRNGVTQCTNNIFSDVAVDPSDPSGRRFAFSGVIDLAQLFGDFQGIRGASVFLDAVNMHQRGPASLGWFT